MLQAAGVISLSQTMKVARRAHILLLVAAVPASSRGQDLTAALSGEAQRCRAALAAIPSSDFVDGERPRLTSLLNDTESLLQSGRIAMAIETLSSVAPGVQGMERAGSGWDDTGKTSGKHMDALTREWEDVGPTLKSDLGRFPAAKPAEQTSFIRAMAEQSLGQVGEQYRVAVDYGRVSGASYGAYYLGRAEGHLAWALFLSRLKTPSAKPLATVTSLGAPIERLEDEIVTAYAKPGSTAQHTNFILANSSLKLAKELNQQGYLSGAMVTMLRSLLALSLATLPTPAREQEATLATVAARFEERFAASGHDHTVGQSLVEKARVSLEKAGARGDDADRERQRASALLTVVIPRYIDLMGGLE